MQEITTTTVAILAISLVAFIATFTTLGYFLAHYILG